MLYPEFKGRYNIIAAKAVAKAKNDKAAAGCVMDVVKLDKEKYRLGHTKVFFRAGVGGWMEEQREDKIGSVLAWLQAGARGKASRMQFKKLQDQKLALYCVQRAIRTMMIAKTWKWMQIWMLVGTISFLFTSIVCRISNIPSHRSPFMVISPDQAEPEVHPVWEIQEGIRGEDCRC